MLLLRVFFACVAVCFFSVFMFADAQQATHSEYTLLTCSYDGFLTFFGQNGFLSTIIGVGVEDNAAQLLAL